MKSRVALRGSVASERVRRLHREHADAAERFFLEGAAVVESAAEALVTALRGGRTLLFFGNGGSAADAQHLAAEFVNRYVRDRPALPALALTTDTSVLTSIANDSEFKSVFARQVEAIGRPGDVAVGISTSGGSANVIEGLRTARARRLVTIGFCGEEGGAMRGLCDHLISVPSKTTARIQEVHILVGHILCQIVEETLYPPK
ncbi:MAG TPA: D-sedoheptulose 7-phosphate isomerase [Candidatus Dormibacteraeota bacterium]|nr:D-sedoheptulose 7-phosphate isomerase [Candidatus Dormibacteraeota bacterium]